MADDHTDDDLERVALDLQEEISAASSTNGTASATEREVAAATWEELLAKPAVTRSCEIVVRDAQGELVERKVVFQAIDPDEYQTLIESHPPKAKQRKDGLEYDPAEFANSLIARSLVEPKATREQVVQLRATGRWTRGELGLLFRTAVEVNHGGLEIPFTRTS